MYKIQAPNDMMNIHTVDERNPAPPGMYQTLKKMG